MKSDPIKDLMAKDNKLTGLVEAMRQQALSWPIDPTNPHA